MAARRTHPKNDDAFDKMFRRIYAFWLAGLLIDAIGIKPTGFNAAGIAISFDRPEAVKGLLFLASLVCTAYLLFATFAVEPVWQKDGYLRNTLWRHLPKGRKSVIALSGEERAALKTSTKNDVRSFNVVLLLAIAGPALAILWLNLPSVIDAVKLIAGK